MGFDHVVHGSVETIKVPDLLSRRRFASERTVVCFLIRRNSDHALAHSRDPSCFLFEKIGPLHVLSLKKKDTYQRTDYLLTI